MPINVNNREADALTREFARTAGVGITQAIVIAMKEALARRREAETPLASAALLRARFGITLNGEARKTLPREAYHEMWEDMPSGENQNNDP